VLRIVDITSPSSPKQLGSYDLLGYAQDVAVSGSRAYVVTSGYQLYYGGFYVLDITNRGAPKLDGEAGGMGYGLRIALTSTTAYVASYTANLPIIDITTPTTPTLIHGDMSRGEVLYGFDLALQGSLVYLADELTGLRIIDITTPTTPRVIGRYPMTCDACTHKIYLPLVGRSSSSN
jgi:hypothetical protein